MNRPPFPLIWDNTLRSAFITCPQKAFWEFFHHLKSPEVNTHLHAGKAWASALETTRLAYYGDKVDALAAQALGLQTLITTYGSFQPPDHGTAANKSLDRMIEAFSYYFRAFPLATDPVQPYIGRNGRPMVEFSFALPLDPTLLHPVTGEPIIYAGRADMIATYAGALSIYDDKTTGSLGKTWGEQWLRRGQFSAYAWAAQQYQIPVTQVVIRGIALLKTSINHAQATPVRTPHHISEWHTQMVRDIRRAIKAWENNEWDLNLSDGCSNFGTCLFIHPCMSLNPEPWLLGGNYQRKVWNPVDRTETIIPIHQEFPQ